MSDRQKGLNIAYEEKFPNADARYCCRHIYSNFKAMFPGLLLKTYFWQAAKSFDVVGHNEAMNIIKDINVEAWRYLDKIPKSAWARHAFSVEIKCDHVTNNFIESFNAWIGELRGRPILTLVDGLRRKLMKKLHKRFQKGCTWTSMITPNILKKLKTIGEQSRRCELMMASECMFEMADMEKTYIVNLSEKKCECGAFQLTGLPCKHAALGIIYRREKLEAYCDPAFMKDQYLKTYASMIFPIPHEKRWPLMPDILPKSVLPPPLRRQQGRPRKNRRREADKGAHSTQTKRSTTLKCSNCGCFGHNKRSCQGGPVNMKNSNNTDQVASRREKPDRGVANTGLAGSVLWDHAEGTVPIVFSSQGSNPSPPTQSATVNDQGNAEASTDGTKRKRGRVLKRPGNVAATGQTIATATSVTQPNISSQTQQL